MNPALTLATHTGIICGDVRPDLLRDETLAQMFRQSAIAYAANIALIFEDKSITYAQLDRWSDAIANFLIQNGIIPGDKIGIWHKRGVELHAAILGIIKVGAAYVPIDREQPAERVELVMTEVGAAACFSEDLLNLSCPIFTVIPMPSGDELVAISDGPIPENNAYVLYTSGSTGKPKGIPISHRNICHLVRAEQSVFNITAADRVYQGFSVSFDMWCEETWISYLAGATIWVADNTTSKSIDELADILKQQGITILHAVPSLLAVMDDNIPTLRLINAGGEACTKQVLNRWGANPNRAFYNSYGPTETTVTATIARLHPGDEITIGDPLPNYNLAVVDENLNQVPQGEQGELIISGPGLAEGYVNLPQLTREKFVDKPAGLTDMPGDKIYRTGDAALIKPDGTIDLQGRFDDQIKLRGYRIELGEIEVRLNAIDGISSAVVAVKKDAGDQEHLVGYIVLKDMLCVEENLIRAELGKVLPSYMVPSVIVTLPEMPRMPSGKINRKALPVPEQLSAFDDIATDDTLDMNAPIEVRFYAVLNKIFPGKTIDPEQDFFNDLGGHSLLAAAFVSRLRRDAGMPQASLKDVYMHRPLKVLAANWEEKVIAEQQPREFNKVKSWRYYTCWAAQTLSLMIIYGLFAIQVFIPYLGYYYIEQDMESKVYAIGTALGLFCLIPPFFTLIAIASKWMLIGRMKEGDYPLWGSYYFRWWFVRTLQNLLPVQFLTGTPLYPVYLRWMGVKVAPDAQLSNLTIGAEDLLTIGADVSISSGVALNNAYVEDGWLKLRRISLGDHAYIGSSALIAGGAVMEEWAELQDLSYLQAGKTIKPGEVWQGSPAVLKETKSLADMPQPIPVSEGTMRRYKLVFALSVFAFPFIILTPLIPTIITVNNLDNAAPDYNFNYLVNVPALAALYIALFAAETILLTRLLQYKVKPGKYPVYSWFYVRKWFTDQLMSLSLVVMHPIYATVYIGTFFRALGAKVGKNTEVSTASSATHPLLEIGDDAFIADAVTLGEADIRGQQLVLAKTTINSRSFVGNSALIPQGYSLPSDMLIGVLSTPPTPEQMADNNARDWFGSPAIAIPRRQESNAFDVSLVSRPSWKRKIARGMVELIRIILPESAIICFSILFIAYGHDIIVDKSFFEGLFWFPIYYLGLMGIPAFLLTVVLKWIFIGKYKAEQKPMWTWKVWRSEAITTTYEALAVPFLLEYLQGTPWLPLALRLMGMKTGKRVWLNTTDFTEHDMIEIGDDTAMNEDCGPQTHLFEDRVMKIGYVKIGERVNVGARTIILYDSEVGNDNHIEPLSLVMKGERLAPGTNWAGSPVNAV
ncbi:Pls/PosA family non-ribosomal peptide synthetase [Mucilaginibacter boryungensis]|nr:Pls/PosA family non-ribosomal peptide synthetase [Mucilaginibacter boryungensis]